MCIKLFEKLAHTIDSNNQLFVNRFLFKNVQTYYVTDAGGLQAVDLFLLPAEPHC